MFQFANQIFGSAALLATGAVIGFFAKEFFFPRLLERWKDQRSLAQTYRRYRDPLFLSAQELANRLHEICETYPTNFLDSSVRPLESDKLEANSVEDPYFRKYKLVSSIYRFCAFLGWLELYRQEIVFLDSGHDEQNRTLDEALSRIRADIADGHINRAADFFRWSDHLIFREELRAIGEAMICTDTAGSRSVSGYGRFSRIFLIDRAEKEHHWFKVAAHFLCNLPPHKERNFRLVRMQRLYIHLVHLMRVLDAKRVPQRLSTRAEEMEAQLVRDAGLEEATGN
jgi:hypothetical protein